MSAHPRLLLLVTLCLSTTGLAACKTEGLEDTSVYVCASRELFTQNVSVVMEKRCGMLDCHGNDFRPMRLYGQYGLRARAVGELNRTGETPTSPREKELNYQSVCNVEPEKMDEVARSNGGQGALRLLLVRKARGDEGHKGGKVFNDNDDFDLCVVGWLRGDRAKQVQEACATAAERLP